MSENLAGSTQSGEHLLLILRRHTATLWRDTAALAAAAIFPFVLWYLCVSYGIIPLNPLSKFAFSVIGPLWLLLIWIGFSVRWTNHFLNLWIISNYRIINIRYDGLLKNSLTAWNLDRVAGVAVAHPNPLHSFFGFGFVVVKLAGGDDEYLVMEDVPMPEHVEDIILKEQSQYLLLEREAAEQEDLLHFVSHEVKGYLSKNKAAFASIIEGDYGSVSLELKTMAGHALADTEKGVKTVMSVLTKSPKDSAERMQPVDLKALVLECVDSVRALARRKNLAIDFVNDGAPYVVFGEVNLLRDQVVLNLLDNAVHYTQSGKIVVELARSTSGVLLVVKDTGVGITEGDMARLFTKGGKGEHSSDINPESTGFGLAAAKQVVESHGGKIWAESEGAGKGSQFYVELPAPPPVSK